MSALWAKHVSRDELDEIEVMIRDAKRRRGGADDADGTGRR
jgi:hypothetical protein